MAYEIHTRKQDVNAVDIQTMASMSSKEYLEYVKNDLLRVDHHGVLRSIAAGYPLAASKEQFGALMDFLREVEYEVGD